MKRKKKVADPNKIQMPLSVFLASYNQNIPAGFPRASIAILKKFQAVHPALFKHCDTWSVAQHRKRLLDWLFTHHDVF